MASWSACGRRPDARSSPGGAARGASASPPERPAPDQRFPGHLRLKSRRQFVAIYNRGRRVVCSSCTIFGLPNELGYTRLGVTVTRKVGGSVVRNRAKRILREIFRRNRDRMSPSMDIVVNAHRSLPNRSLDDVARDFIRGYERLVRRRTR